MGPQSYDKSLSAYFLMQQFSSGRRNLIVLNIKKQSLGIMIQCNVDISIYLERQLYI